MRGNTGGVVALICAGVIALSPPACASRQDADLVITGVTFIDGTGAPPRARTAILIREGRIVEVVRDTDAAIPAGASVIDAGGKFVIPGLVDPHAPVRRTSLSISFTG